MREMVYDDTRWVQRLRLMNCWDEGEARRRAEATRRKTSGILPVENADREGIGVDENIKGDIDTGTADAGATIFDASRELSKSTNPGAAFPKKTPGDGFDAVALSPAQHKATTEAPIVEPAARLTVFSRSKSIRGGARQEYGKIHGALSPFYLDAIDSKSHTNAVVFRIYRDPDQQAQMLSNLQRFARSDISQGWQSRELKFGDLVDAFENAVAKEFEHGLIDEDIDGKMRKYAQVLITLNGGDKGIQMFITRSHLISERQSLGNPLGCLNTGGFSMEQSYRFFSNVSAEFNDTVAIMDRVFPASVDAVKPLLQRVGQEVISEYVATLFKEAHQMNLEAYLKAVSTTYSQSVSFAQSLRPNSDPNHTFSGAVDKVILVAFQPHIDLYLREEIDYFKGISEAEVKTWERQLSEQDASMQSMYMSNVNRQADKRDFLTSFKKVVMIPVNVLPTFPMSSPFGSKPATAKTLVNGEMLEVQPVPSQNPTRSSSPNPTNTTNAALGTPRVSTPLAEAPTTELAAKTAIINSRLEGIRSLFSIEVALHLVHAAKASIERAAAFVRFEGHFGEDARKECEHIFVSLLQSLGTGHVKAGFDKALDHLSGYKPQNTESKEQSRSVTPLITFLELVNVGDLIQQMLDVFYEQELIATKLTDRSDFLSPAVKEKKRFEQMLDERVAAGLNKGIEVLMAEVDYVCATTQKAEDFNPGANGNGSPEIMDIGPTETAKQVVNIVSSHTKMLVGSTDKTMLDVFNQEVGLRLFTALCKHLKRQRVSVDGSIKLISDMSHYSSFISTLKNASLSQYFTALRELAQIYLVAPADAKELASIIADGDRFHGIFRAEEVYEFAERRADWYLVKPKVERAMYGVGCQIM